jgi:hypothetical protein
MRAMLRNLRNNLRFYWLVLLRDLNAAFTLCRRCRKIGAYPCSIAACVPLCNACAKEESIKLDGKTTAT